MSAPLLLAVNFVLAAGLFTGLWFTARRIGDVSFVDAFWGFGIVLIAALILILFPGIRRRLEKAIGRLFTILLIGAVAFLAVTVLMHG